MKLLPDVQQNLSVGILLEKLNWFYIISIKIVFKNVINY